MFQLSQPYMTTGRTIALTSIAHSTQKLTNIKISSVQFSHSVMSDSLWPHKSQHARPPCPSPTPGVHSNWSLVFPILLSSSVSLHWLLRKAFLSLLGILWNSAFRCLYLSFSPLLFASLLFTAICKASPDSHFAFFHFFSMGMVLIPVSCTMSRTSVHSSSGTLSNLVP